MKQGLFLHAIIGMLALSLFACEKTDHEITKGDKVELYLLESYTKIENTRAQIDESTVITHDSPLITYSDFLSYDKSEYAFELSDEAKSTIMDLEHSVAGIAFAIKVDDDLIYTGYFWPSYSSASCDWVVIDPMHLYLGNTLLLRMGYPGPPEGVVIPDNRNDIRILNVFEADNKLKD